jgi:ubiquinone/menaquinone biosynthesis C-methylase UbiE
MTDDYVHGYASEEQDRLVLQAEHWRDELILSGTTLVPGTRLLEVGCGVGAVLAILGQAFPEVALAGVDVEERQVEAARRYLGGLGLKVDLRQGDALALPYADGSFDHVWMMWFLEHLAEPVAALSEARRVLVQDGSLTAIEVDYNSVWASPTSEGFEALFTAVARAMESAGRSDAGARLAGWLEEAGFGSIDPGERRLDYSGEELVRQVPYVAAVVGSTLPTLVEMPDTSSSLLYAGLEDLQALPATPDAAMGWSVYKASAVR